MKQPGSICLLPAAAALVSLASFGQALPPRYAVFELGSFDGGSTRARALNDAGQSTGDSGFYGGVSHAFLGHPDGTIENIETLPGWGISQGQAINSKGQVAGVLRDARGQKPNSFFLYTPGAGMVDIGTLGGAAAFVTAMNDSGDIIGASFNQAGHFRAFLYTAADGFRDLNLALGANIVSALDINNAGHVVGFFETPQAELHGFVWDGQPLDLGGPLSVAMSLNDAGVVVGLMDVPGVGRRAIRYTSDDGISVIPDGLGAAAVHATLIAPSGLIVGQYFQMNTSFVFYHTTDGQTVGVGTPPGGINRPIAVNDAGRILIQREDSQTFELAILVFDPGSGVHDLSEAIIGDLPWTIVEAWGMNAAGQVLVSGETPDGYATALLTPVTPGDLNGDGHVDQADLGALLAHYGVENGATYEQGDIDGDGAVNQADLGILLAAFGN